MTEFFENFINEEEGGGVLISGIYLFFFMFLAMAFVLNIFVLKTKKEELQIVADCASHAGTLAVKKQYEVYEKSDFGKTGYHVYTELEPHYAAEYSELVLRKNVSLINDIPWEYMTYSFNKPGYLSTCWNPHTFRYYDAELSTEKQYKNGDMSIEMKNVVPVIMPLNMSGSRDSINVITYSQTAAKGSLEYH